MAESQRLQVMSGITKARFNEIQTAARTIIAEHGGREKVDAVSGSARKPLMVAMSHQLVSRETISYDSARRHIAKALRVLRGEYVKDGRANNGGWRKGAGRPSLTEIMAEHKEYYDSE